MKWPAWQCRSPAPASYKAAASGSGRLVTPTIGALAHWRIGASGHCLGSSSQPPPKWPTPLRKPAASKVTDPTAFGHTGEEAMGEFKRTAGQRAARRPHLYAVAELAHRSVQQQHCR